MTGYVVTSLFAPPASWICGWKLLFCDQAAAMVMIRDGQVPRPLTLLHCQRLISSPHLRLGLGGLGIRHSLFKTPALCFLRLAPFHFGHIGDLRHRRRTGLPVVAENNIAHLAAEAFYGGM